MDSLRVILVLFASFVIATNCHSISSHNHTAFFIFGDSWLDNGVNSYFTTTPQYQSNFPPYGETYFGYATGRFSDGCNIPDFISEFANLSLVPPPYFDPRFVGDHIFGVNFASAGAGALVQTNEGKVISLEMQGRYFIKVADRLTNNLGIIEAEKVLSNAVYLVFMGNNDYVYPSGTPLEFVEQVVGNTTSVMKELYKRGARKFVVINMPPLGCLPGNRVLNPDGSNQCQQNLQDFSELHNVVLPVALSELEKQLTGFEHVLYDYFTDLTSMINYPSKYGFEEGKSGCCGKGPFRGDYTCGGQRGDPEYELCDDPSTHVFWDSYHLTESAYKHVATRMWGSIKHFFIPPTTFFVPPNEFLVPPNDI